MNGDIQGLPLALCTQIVHGGTWQTIFGARDQTWVDIVQDQYLTCSVSVVLKSVFLRANGSIICIFSYYLYICGEVEMIRPHPVLLRAHSWRDFRWYQLSLCIR